MRTWGFALVALSWACSPSSAGPADAGPYVNPDCGVFFSAGCPGAPVPFGFDAGCSPYACMALPATCAQDVSCDCVQCLLCACSGGGGVECTFDRDAGTFRVSCVNP